MFKLKSVFGMMVVLLIFVGMVGCTNDEETEVPSSEMTTEVVDEGTETEVASDLLTQDRAGFDFVMPEEVEGIVSLAPAVTLMLIDLGLEERIIAMDTHSAFMYGNARGLPVFDMLAPEIESLVALNPDLIFASAMAMMGDEANDPFVPLKELGMSVAYIPSSDSISDIQEDLRFIATVTGVATAGEALITQMNAEIEEIIALVGQVEEAPTVYFEISPAPDMFSFGHGVFLHEMIELMGARNVFAEQESWLPVEAESLVALNPDVIFTNVDFIPDPVAEILNRPGWEGMDAIVNGRVYLIDANDTSQPTHQITRALRVMAIYLHGLDE